MTSRRILLAAIPSLLLAGCGLRREIPEGTTLKEGSFAMHVEKDGKLESVQGRYEIIQRKNFMSFEIISPVGSTVARVSVTPKSAILEHDGQTETAPTAEELMQKNFGFSLPVSMMAMWVDGTPDTNYEFTKVNFDSFAQSGWRVDVTRRYMSGKAQRVDINNLDHTKIKVAIRLTNVIKDEWY